LYYTFVALQAFRSKTHAFVTKGDPEMSSILRLPPHADEAEKSILGSVLIDKDAIVDIAVVLQPEMFYNDRHGLIFAARSNYLKTFEDRHSSFNDRIKYDFVLYLLNPTCRELMDQGEWVMSVPDDNFKEISFSIHNNKMGWESVLEVLSSVNPEKIGV